MAEVEKIASDRYRIRARDHLITVSAQDLLDLMNYALEHTAQLRQEASQAQEHEDTQKYMEHYYEGGE